MYEVFVIMRGHALMFLNESHEGKLIQMSRDKIIMRQKMSSVLWNLYQEKIFCDDNVRLKEKNVPRKS